MQDFRFFVTDDRYDVPSLMLVQTENIERARALAQALLTDRHHLEVEVWGDGSTAALFTLTSELPQPDHEPASAAWRRQSPPRRSVSEPWPARNRERDPNGDGEAGRS